MKDIDFDELDKAVGSVLGNNDTDDSTSAAHSAVASSLTAVAEPAPTDAPAPAVATSDSDNSTTEEPAISTHSSALSAISLAPDLASTPPAAASEAATHPAETNKPLTSPARRRGQFLDMVHPSADMRSKTPLPTTARRTLTPLNASTVPEPIAEPASLASPITTIAPAVESTTSDASFSLPDPFSLDSTIATSDPPEPDTQPDPQSANTTQHSWPDPIDFMPRQPHAAVTDETLDNIPDEAVHETTDALSGLPEIETLDEAQSSAGPLSINTAWSDEESPQTPFVSDAKVDKRPLGAFAAPEEAGLAGDFSQPTLASEPSDTSALELNTAVNSIESAGIPTPDSVDNSDDTPAPISAAPSAASSAPAPTTAETAPNLSTSSTDSSTASMPPAVPSDPPAAATTSIAAPEPLLPVTPAPARDESKSPAESLTPTAAAIGITQSIPQQYKTAAAPAAADEAHALFDPEEYHQPLLLEGKKKSKKGVLITVLLIILLIIGAGIGYLAYSMGV